MEPIPETRQAIDEFGPFLPGSDQLVELRRMGAEVTKVVPECVGLSLARNELGVTFTLVASGAVIAGLDGLQYLDGGPCVEAVTQMAITEFTNHDVLDEATWEMFSRGTASAGIASTLTLPIMTDDLVVGSVNLYASTRSAFTGKHEAVAAIFAAWAPGAIANADLSFSTRLTAAEAPAVLLDETRIDIAVAVVASTFDVSLAEARTRLRESAVRAGVSESDFARIVIDQAMTEPPDGCGEPGSDAGAP